MSISFNLLWYLFSKVKHISLCYRKTFILCSVTLIGKISSLLFTRQSKNIVVLPTVLIRIWNVNQLPDICLENSWRSDVHKEISQCDCCHVNFDLISPQKKFQKFYMKVQLYFFSLCPQVGLHLSLIHIQMCIRDSVQSGVLQSYNSFF